MTVEVAAPGRPIRSKRCARKRASERLYYDKHGLVVYPAEPDAPAAFARMSGSVFVTHGTAAFTRALEHPSAWVPMSKVERLAFDLFSGASFAALSDARFMMLMMSLEVLIDQRPRSEHEQQHIQVLI